MGFPVKHGTLRTGRDAETCG